MDTQEKGFASMDRFESIVRTSRPVITLGWIVVFCVFALSSCRDEKPAEQTPAAPLVSDSTAEGMSAATSTIAPPLAAAGTATNTPCPKPPACGDDCSNVPFEPTNCWTTPYGPAAADIIVGDPLASTNMLYCEGGTYALCFFSGPPTPTGNNPENPPLPCVVEGGVARCACQAYTGGGYFVDINGILNLGAYNETVVACGADGSRCASIATCGLDGRQSGCSNLPKAPVCQYIANQNRNDPDGSLIPNADLISTFSFAMHGNYPIGQTSCASGGPYAGCMTAPCFFEEGSRGEPENGEAVACECPIANGPFQVGQNDQSCTIPSDGTGSYVWSASYSVANQ
jgi:hypothetical protein